ncbi:cell division protein ZapA [Geomonas sp. Red32]|nr:cell division protein ZapA [Geomonas sp. Red32]
MAQVESLVNEKLAEATEAVSSGDHQLVVILTLMNLAEAYLASQKQLEEERLSCRERISSLIGRVDNAV